MMIPKLDVFIDWDGAVISYSKIYLFCYWCTSCSKLLPLGSSHTCPGLELIQYHRRMDIDTVVADKDGYKHVDGCWVHKSYWDDWRSWDRDEEKNFNKITCSDCFLTIRLSSSRYYPHVRFSTSRKLDREHSYVEDLSILRCNI